MGVGRLVGPGSVWRSGSPVLVRVAFRRAGFNLVFFFGGGGTGDGPSPGSLAVDAITIWQVRPAHHTP